MRLRVDQLISALQRSGVKPIYVIMGDEPLQKMEAEDAIRTAARKAGFIERQVLEVGAAFDWSLLFAAVANRSLFAEKRLFELRLGTHKPGREGAQVLTSYANNIPADHVLMLTASKLDRQTQQTKWFKVLEKCGVVIAVWPVDSSRLPDWIKQRFMAMGKRISVDAATLLATQVEGNLLAARQEIDKLCLLAGDDEKISTQLILRTLTANSRYDPFMLMDSVYAGDVRRCLTMLAGLQSEGSVPMQLYGIIMYELRRIVSMACQLDKGESMRGVFDRFRVWPQRQTVTERMLRRYSSTELQAMLARSISLEKTIKSARERYVWDTLRFFLLQLAARRIYGMRFLETIE